MKPVEPEEEYDGEEEEETPAPDRVRPDKPVKETVEDDYDSDFDEGADTEW